MADRIAGAIVDLAYKKDNNPKIAVEVLIGHGYCHIIAESSVNIDENEDSIKEKALACDNVKRHLDGLEVQKILVIKNRIVTIVAK